MPHFGVYRGGRKREIERKQRKKKVTNVISDMGCEGKEREIKTKMRW